MRAAALPLLALLLAPATAFADDFDAGEWESLPDDDARAALEKLRAAVVDNDAKALVALAGKDGVVWLGDKLGRKRLASRLKEQGVPGFIGIPADATWRIVQTEERPDELLVGVRGKGADRIARLEKRKGRWVLAEVKAHVLPAATTDGKLTLVLLLQRSTSMGFERLEAAKQAARAAVDSLASGDQVAVIAFDSAPTTVVKLQSASNRTRINVDIARIEAGLGTDVATALLAAAEVLGGVTTRKHVILLLDGRPKYEGVAALVDEMRAAGTTVSTIGSGDADRTLLQLVAEHGDGRMYIVDDAAQLPAVFVKEAREAPSPE